MKHFLFEAALLIVSVYILKAFNAPIWLAFGVGYSLAQYVAWSRQPEPQRATT